MDIPQKNWTTTAHALGGRPHSCKYQTHRAGKEVYNSLTTGCTNAAKTAVGLWHRQLVIPGVAPLHFVLCLSPRRVESRTRHTSWFPQWWGRGNSTTWWFLFIPLNWEEEKGGDLTGWVFAERNPSKSCSPSLCRRQVLTRDPLIRGERQLVAGDGQCQPSTLVALIVLCLPQTPAAVGAGSRWWTKWHQSRLPLQLFFSHAVLTTQDMKSFKMTARFLSALFFFFMVLFKGTKSMRGVPEICAAENLACKTIPSCLWLSLMVIRAFQPRLGDSWHEAPQSVCSDMQNQLDDNGNPVKASSGPQLLMPHTREYFFPISRTIKDMNYSSTTECLSSLAKPCPGISDSSASPLVSPRRADLEELPPAAPQPPSPEQALLHQPSRHLWRHLKA